MLLLWGVSGSSVTLVNKLTGEIVIHNKGCARGGTSIMSVVSLAPYAQHFVFAVHGSKELDVRRADTLDLVSGAQIKVTILYAILCYSVLYYVIL